MSADSFHHRVENSLHQMKKVYDFNDFQTAMQSSTPRVTAVGMEPKDFLQWKDYSTRKKMISNCERPYLHNMVQVQAEGGQLFLTYQTELEGPWKQL